MAHSMTVTLSPTTSITLEGDDDRPEELMFSCTRISHAMSDLGNDKVYTVIRSPYNVDKLIVALQAYKEYVWPQK